LWERPNALTRPRRTPWSSHRRAGPQKWRHFGGGGGVAAQSELFYTGATPRETTYDYDALDRLVRVHAPGDTITQTSYDAKSHTVTDPNGKATTTRYDAYGRPVAVERSLDGQPVVTQSTYDLLGRLVGMQDAVGSQWTWTYDSLGRLRVEDDPDAGRWTYEYDHAGRLLTQQDAKGQITTLGYDPLVGRLQTKTNPDGTVSYTYGEHRGNYSNVGRLTAVESSAGVLALDYDALGRATRQIRTYDDGRAYQVTKTYDGASGALSAITYPDGDVVGPLSYDEAGRLRSIPAIIASLTYDARGLPLSRVNLNGTQSAWTSSADRGLLDQVNTALPGRAPTEDPSRTSTT
jgi:YD repeat-containing protein